MAVLKIILILSLVQVLSSSAQSNDEFEEWQKKEQQSLEQFKDENDREFLDFLEKDWRAFKASRGIVQDKTPKPVETPIAVLTPVGLSSPLASSAEEDPIVAPLLPPVVRSVLPEIEPVMPKSYQAPEVVLHGTDDSNTIEFDFLGTNLNMACGSIADTELRGPLDKESIGAYWKALSLGDYEECLRQAQEVQTQMSLNDWGYYLLLHRAGAHLFEENQNQTALFVWFMLSKSGYQVKVGYGQGRVYLLLPTEQALYGIPFFTFDQTKFYEVSVDGSAQATSLATYDGTYPGANKRLNLRVVQSPQVGGGNLDRTFSFTYQGQSYQVPVHFEQSTIDFFAQYPQTDMGVYFEASPAPAAKASLLQALHPIVAGRTEAETVNLLLRFVQTAFAYQVDAQQFGREKIFFPEETLFYPFSDCEDRAILFAFLVQELLGLEVVGLDYPGHMATAVKFTEEQAGDSVLYQGQKYMVCDPTYINAEAGMGMSHFKGVNPGIIPISSE
jgi:hypothetical protein